MKQTAFSLIELLVVVAIIGILAAVGVVGYTAYIDGTKKEAAIANGNQVARAIEQDFLSLANELSGTTELGNSLTIGGIKLTTDITPKSSCYKYAENINQYLNNKWKNAYDPAVTYSVNLHTYSSSQAAASKLKPGQIGVQCANLCSAMKGEFYIHTCSCTGGSDCTLFDFAKSDYNTFVADSDCPGASCQYDIGTDERDAYDYVNHDATVARTNKGLEIWTGSASDADASRKVLVGNHMPEWLCPKPVQTMGSSAVGCSCDDSAHSDYPCK